MFTCIHKSHTGHPTQLKDPGIHVRLHIYVLTPGYLSVQYAELIHSNPEDRCHSLVIHKSSTQVHNVYTNRTPYD